MLCGSHTWNVALPTPVPPILTARVIMMLEEWMDMVESIVLTPLAT